MRQHLLAFLRDCKGLVPGCSCLPEIEQTPTPFYPTPAVALPIYITCLIHVGI